MRNKDNARITLDLSPADYANLQRLKEMKGMQASEVIRAAIRRELDLAEHIRDGGEVAYKKKDERWIGVVFADMLPNSLR